jgi:hypothetical protein
MGGEMVSTVVPKDAEYILNHCAKFLARDNLDHRHSFLGVSGGEPRGRISEAWRFPIVDAHDSSDNDRYDFNDVTFVYAIERDKAVPASVELLTTCLGLNRPEPLNQVGDSLYWAVTLQVSKGSRYRYRFIVDGVAVLDPINPQTETLPTGDIWSSFFTWAYNEPISLERWEFTLLDRITRHILPFNNREGRNFMERMADEARAARHLYRLDVSAGVANYIDKILAREERHQLSSYKTCLDMLAKVLRKRNPGRPIEALEEAQFIRLYDEMADVNRVPALFADGWDQQRYGSPSYFLYLLRRHAWTGAFAHPKWGGNPGGMAWAYLSETFRITDQVINDQPTTTAFDWRQAMEPPLGTSAEYLG